jgi:chromosome segregation protein
MKDFIFAGTATRKPLNIAEVTLTLVDVEKDPNDELATVSFTRRIYRDGGGEYLINGKPSRLKEMQTLFWDSGLSKDAFIIIEQGKVDQLITWTPLERRGIFEEAAGIIRFKQRRKESMQRLDQLDQNLARIKDIHLEICGQVEILEEQAKRAMEYKGIQERILLLERESMVAKYQEHHVIMVRQRNDLAEVLQEKEKGEEQSLSLADCLVEGKQSAHRLSLDCEDRSQKKSATAAQLQVLETELKNSIKRREETKRQLVALAQEIQYLQEKRGAQLEESSILEERLEALEEEFDEAKTSLETAQQTLADIEERLGVIDQEREELEKQRQEAEKELQTTALGVKERATRIDGWEQTHEQVSVKHRQLEELELHNQTEVEEKEQASLELAERIAQEREELEESKEQELALKKQLEQSSAGAKLTEKSLLECRARYETLDQLHRKMEGMSRGTQRVLKEAVTVGSPLYGKFAPLYQEISLPSKDERLYALILRFYCQTLVAQKEGDVALLIRWAEENQVEGFSVYPKELGLDRLLAVESLETVEDLVRRGFRFEGVAASKSGMVDRNGVLFYGQPTIENNPVLREQELNHLQEQIDLYQERLGKEQDQIRNTSEQMAQLLERKGILEQQLRRDEMKQMEASFNLQRAKAQQQQQLIQKVALEAELKQLQQQIQAFKTELEALQETQNRYMAELRRLHQGTQSSYESYRLLEQQQKKYRQVVESATHTYNQCQQEQLLCQQKLAILAQQDQERQSRLEKSQEQLEELQGQQENLIEEHDHFLISQEELKAIYGEVCEELAKLKREKELIDQSNSTLTIQLETLQEQLHALELKEKEMQVAMEQRRTFLEAIEKEFEERYHTPVSQEKTELAIPSDEVERELRRTKKALEQMGNVNLTAIEQFQERHERKTFIEEQLKDLIDSKQELLEAIAKLDMTSRTMFKETFDQIRFHFQKNFQILFNGGQADISFCANEDGTPIDLLEAGIDIMARPPGKQMRSIQLLSGGEKCLTAMALLFAIFEVKPSPFCILDEIDAPLDETNIDRFTSLVKHYIDTTQFIVISHNKRTMSIADRLFGVSMEERGVSKVLSVAFEKNHK